VLTLREHQGSVLFIFLGFCFVLCMWVWTSFCVMWAQCCECLWMAIIECRFGFI